MTDEEKYQMVSLMIMHNLEKDMKTYIQNLKSLRPALIKAQRKYEHLIEKYRITKTYLEASEKKRDILLQELTKSSLNKESVKNDTPAVPS